MDFSKSIERTLFEAASGIADQVERNAFLDRTCHGDPSLRARLEGLLNLQERAEDFFDVPPVKIPVAVTRIAILEVRKVLRSRNRCPSRIPAYASGATSLSNGLARVAMGLSIGRISLSRCLGRLP